MRDPRNILITGASSGIGAALALAYARPGIRLGLGGRNRSRLSAVAKTCRQAGAEVETAELDVTAAPAVRSWIESSDDAASIDLLIANAGISGGTFGGGESFEQARTIFAVNVDGVINSAHPAAERMQSRGRGQIAIMSSLAGFRGIPGAPAYSASKAAVRAYGEALRGRLRPYGVGVSVICPGFIRTPMTDVNQFPMPMLMEAERAARIIRRGLARDRARIAFPLTVYAFVRLIAALPPALVDPIYRRMPEKR